MKKKVYLTSILLFITIITFCQIKHTSQFVPIDMSSMKRSLNKSQAHYEHNKEYINTLINWTFKLKSQTSDKYFRLAMDYYYRELKSFGGKDLTKFDNEIRGIELSIREEIDEYNLRIRESNNPDKYWEKGNKDLTNKHYKSAIDNYDKLEQLTPEFSGLYLNRGLAYQNINRYGSALKDYSKYISLEPNNSSGYYYRAWFYYQNQQYSKAIEDFDKSSKLDPTKNTELYNARGWSKYYIGDYMGAVEDFNQFVENDPNSAYAYYSRGSAKSVLKDYRGAIRDYSKAIEIEPQFSMAYNNLGWSKFKQKKFDEAIEAVNNAIDIDPVNFVAYESRSEIKLSLNDYDGCIKDCKKALELNSKLSNCYFLLGRAYFNLGEELKACESWSKAGELGVQKAYDYISKHCN